MKKRIQNTNVTSAHTDQRPLLLNSSESIKLATGGGDMID